MKIKRPFINPPPQNNQAKPLQAGSLMADRIAQWQKAQAAKATDKQELDELEEFEEEEFLLPGGLRKAKKKPLGKKPKPSPNVGYRIDEMA